VLTLSLEGCHFHALRIFRLLNTCQLPALRRLQIRATLETITLDAAKSFADLCVKLPRLAELDTNFDAEWYPHIPPSVRAPSLCITDPDMTLVTQLPSTIRRLQFISSSFAPTFYTCLWTVFDHLLAYRSDIQDIHMPASSWCTHRPKTRTRTFHSFCVTLFCSLDVQCIFVMGKDTQWPTIFSLFNTALIRGVCPFSIHSSSVIAFAMFRGPYHGVCITLK
jgi:hypothetical protein